jgi:hypothetical protein
MGKFSGGGAGVNQDLQDIRDFQDWDVEGESCWFVR